MFSDPEHTHLLSYALYLEPFAKHLAVSLDQHRLENRRRPIEPSRPLHSAGCRSGFFKDNTYLFTNPTCGIDIFLLEFIFYLLKLMTYMGTLRCTWLWYAGAKRSTYEGAGQLIARPTGRESSRTVRESVHRTVRKSVHKTISFFFFF